MCPILIIHGSVVLHMCIFTLIQYGETALIFACKVKNIKFVRRLLSMGANPNIANNVS